MDDVNMLMSSISKDRIIKAMLENLPPHIVEKIRKELLPKWYDCITYEDLCETKFFKYVGKESVLVNPGSYDLEDGPFHQVQDRYSCVFCECKGSISFLYSHAKRCSGLLELYESCLDLEDFCRVIKEKYGITFKKGSKYVF